MKWSQIGQKSSFQIVVLHVCLCVCTCVYTYHVQFLVRRWDLCQYGQWGLGALTVLSNENIGKNKKDKLIKRRKKIKEIITIKKEITKYSKKIQNEKNSYRDMNN